jgi:1,4-alpha-glucan branching enzyme
MVLLTSEPPEETAVIKLSPAARHVKVTFVLPVDHAIDGCSVVGDFNGWQPGAHQMRRRSNGTQSASVRLPRGARVRFRYLGDNGHWFNDPDAAEFDGSDSILVV